MYIGSNGDTFFEIREFLDFGDFDDDSVFTALKDPLRAFSSERTKMRPKYHWNNKIRILIDERAKPSNRFNIWTKRYFNAEIDSIDFKRDGHIIGDQINESLQIDLNQQNIKVFKTDINSETKLVVMSAVTFKSKLFLS